jgi:hypothetical protein
LIVPMSRPSSEARFRSIFWNEGLRQTREFDFNVEQVLETWTVAHALRKVIGAFSWCAT